ncbi:MAG: hypothetical protein QM766_22130 [Burkholderiaceae bacterium]
MDRPFLKGPAFVDRNARRRSHQHREWANSGKNREDGMPECDSKRRTDLHAPVGQPMRRMGQVGYRQLVELVPDYRW